MQNLTENGLSLRLLRVSLIVFLVLTKFLNPVQSQQLSKLKSIESSSIINTVSIDRQGYFYAAFENGDINKYSRTGEFLYNFSPSKNGVPTIIEAWQGLKIFSYYQAFQEYLFLDRFLNNSERFDISVEPTSFSSIATISGDDNLWLVDAQALTLKKLDVNTKQVLIETPLNLNLPAAQYSFSHIREYQNKLYISDPNHGLLVFDRFGNFLELLELNGLEYFSFHHNELIYIAEDGVKLLNIYNQQKREIELPDPSYKFVLMENSFLICFAENRIDLYQIN